MIFYFCRKCTSEETNERMNGRTDGWTDGRLRKLLLFSAQSLNNVKDFDFIHFGFFLLTDNFCCCCCCHYCGCSVYVRSLNADRKVCCLLSLSVIAFIAHSFFIIFLLAVGIVIDRHEKHVCPFALHSNPLYNQPMKFKKCKQNTCVRGRER